MASIPDIQTITEDVFQTDGMVIAFGPVWEFGTGKRDVQKVNKAGVPLYAVTVIIHGAGAKVKIASETPLDVNVGDVVRFENLRVGMWAMGDKKKGFFYDADAVIVRNR